MNIDSSVIVAVIMTVLAVVGVLALRRMGGGDTEKNQSEQNRRS